MGTVEDEPEPNRDKVSLEQLEWSVHVPVEDQIIELATDPVPAWDSDWDDEWRQIRLAGGA